MAGWSDLARELDAWGESGRTVTMWWRDDDAARAVPALWRLLELAAAERVPLCLAVIPASAEPDLAAALERHPAVRLAQHGFRHANHAEPQARKVELGGRRSQQEVLQELAAGACRMHRLFGARSRPVLVPPWNRIAGPLLQHLPALGFVGISRHGPRAAPVAAPGLAEANVHIDPIDWRGTRGFLGEAACLGRLCAVLAARRRGETDPQEPTGLLSHHLDHDAAGWAFLQRLLSRSRAHPAVRWLGSEAIFEA